MSEMVTVESTWDAGRRLLVTRLHGVVDADDVARWERGLRTGLDAVPIGLPIKLIVDLHGYAPQEIAAHKVMRAVVPRALAQHGMRTALLDLFHPIDVPLRRTRGIAIVAVAHVHHDAHKMHTYDRTLGRPHERFFASYDDAARWIDSIDTTPAACSAVE